MANSLVGYDPDVFLQIENAVKEYIRRFSGSKEPNFSPTPILYFQGPPGIGKIFVVEQIGKALKLSIIKSSIATLKI